DSFSMEQEQANLAAQIPGLVRDLASPPDRDADGMPDWPAMESLRVAIATSDMGAGTLELGSTGGARCTMGGKDGALQGTGVYEWRAGDDPDAFAAAVGAVVRGVGINGCGFEQQLEATARAVSRVETTGFPRAESLLAVIVVSDEDDCSVESETFFSEAPNGERNVWCMRQNGRLTPVETLLSQIRGNRTDAQFVFAAITGVPVDLESNTTAAQILQLPEMQHTEIVDGMGNLVPQHACEGFTSAGLSLGRAAPGRRFVEVAAMVPGSVVTSICTDDFGPAIAQIANRIGSQIRGVCLERALPTSGDQVDCAVSVTLPAGERCDAFPAYEAEGLDGDRPRCRVQQLGDGVTSGFYYDGSDASCPKLAITDDAQPPIGSEVRAECFVTVQRPEGDDCARRLRTGLRDRIAVPGRALVVPGGPGPVGP
ncbi:MAG: hypothetical protein K8H88_18340, partial [Sandaracinaceae bacterium]|nr:hypothetical protein [Sandaracinaceae bacterium]